MLTCLTILFLYVFEGAIGTISQLLHDIAKEFSTVHYFDPTSKIDANINILKDQFHPTIAGNELIAKELHKYIHTIKYNQGSLD